MRQLAGFLLLLFCAACTSHDALPLLDGKSIGDLEIGKAPPTLDGRRLVLRQWQRDENGASYELLQVKVRNVIVDVEVYDGKIWRMSIEEPGLSSADGTQVGSKAARVLEANSTVQPVVGPGPTIFLVSSEPCGVSYLTDLDFPESADSEPTRVSVKPLLSNARVTRMFVTGCAK